MFFFILTLFQIMSNDTIIVVRVNENTSTTRLEKMLVDNVFLLYSKKENRSIPYKYVYIKEFGELFEFIETYKYKNNVLAVNSITITPERELKYEFSQKYVDVTSVLIGLKNDKSLQKNPIIGVISGSLHEQVAANYKKKQACTIKKYLNYNELEAGLIKKEVNYIVGENVETWNNNNLKIVFEFEDFPSGYGMLFPKNSNLKNKLQEFQSYFLRSKSFLNQLRELYGEEVYNYFQAFNKKKAF